ncbi:MAG TPA: GGDEF domain-containing protein [Candidatus Bathyarchaeia archaeon]|nr:GGDEF domain-containing protein [Candidatus Bathyarchaeia archaeon]
MHPDFNALPALIALVILVAVFAAISRHHTRERVRLWLAGWILVLLRAAVQFANPPQPAAFHVKTLIGLCSLELASAIFVVSVARHASSVARQVMLGVVLAVPALVYTSAMVASISSPALYYGVAVAGCAGALLLLAVWYRKLSIYVALVGSATIVVTGLVVRAIAVGRADYGVHIILAAMNFAAAGLFWYRLRRNSAGVLATVFGFFCWGASFPAAILLRRYISAARLDVEVWDIPKYLVAIGMIVTLLEEQIMESEHLAYHDALTGLPNRRLLQDRLLQAMAHGARSGRKVAVLLLDLDDFKSVNDTFGHRIGDGVLQEVVGRLSARLRAADTLARTGGDEFTVISEVADAQGAQTLVWALEAALLLPLRVDRRTVKLGVSIGFAIYPDDATDAGDLCALADRAMYAAKHGGRSLRPADPAF